jgi:DNA-binding MarR family transcriptional regulator
VTPRSRKGSGVRVDPTFVEEHPDADPTATELVINLLVTASLLESRLDRILREARLTLGSFNVLQVVAGDPEPVTPSDIAGRIPVPVTTATVTGVLDTLVRNGYVERRPHPTDRRRLLVHLTAGGREALGTVLPRILEGEKQWTGGMSKARRADLTAGLGAMQQRLRAPDEPS